MEVNNNSSEIHRSHFGKDFVFGAASSSYQIEGGVAEGGRGKSIWDTFTHRPLNFVMDGSNGDKAVYSYGYYKEDVKALKKIGTDAYRFSISWPRVLPGGKVSAGVNRDGIKYYNDLINELIANDIEPYVTLFHWDVPQALEDEYGGCLNRQIVNDFCEFAELCFWEFGDRVKNWITLNEPSTFVTTGYVTGVFAPGRGIYSADHFIHSTPQHRSAPLDASTVGKGGADQSSVVIDSGGDPSREPYLVAHHLLLAHAEAVHAYKLKFKGGKIGLAAVAEFYEPLTNSANDKEAAQRGFDFNFGWFVEPIVRGRYPKRMSDRVDASRLMPFSEEESKKLKGSYDFIGINYYTSKYATDDTTTGQQPSYLTDKQVKNQSEGPDGKTLIGPKEGTSGLCLYPQGLYKVLCLLKTRYENPLVYIMENGMDQKNEPKQTVSEACQDEGRITYLRAHLNAVKQAKDQNGVNVKAYFVWSLLDSFEWIYGYTIRYGLIHINYNDDFARYPKDSALWYMNFLNEVKHPSHKLLTSKRALDNADHDGPVRKIQKF